MKNTDIPLEEIYERYFDAPESEKENIFADMKTLREGEKRNTNDGKKKN